VAVNRDQAFRADELARHVVDALKREDLEALQRLAAKVEERRLEYEAAKSLLTAMLAQHAYHAVMVGLSRRKSKK
jgi:hypothetical protein